VFDEAHNVASTSEDCNSIELSTVVLGAAIEQLSALKEAMLKSARGIKSKAKVTLQTTKNYDETVHHDPEQN
jgi:Rad3-related DNA helicase